MTQDYDDRRDYAKDSGNTNPTLRMRLARETERKFIRQYFFGDFSDSKDQDSRGN